MGFDPKNKRFAGRYFSWEITLGQTDQGNANARFSDGRYGSGLGLPNTGHLTCHRYLTRDRSSESDRSVTCDRYFEEAGNALSK